MRIHYQPAPAEGSQCLKFHPPDCPRLPTSRPRLFLLHLPVLLVSGYDSWQENTDACWKHVLLRRTQTRTRVSFAATLSQLPCALFSEVRRWEEYCFCAWDRPWQWCIELHILSFSLIRMQLPGGEQMAKPSSPPAGCCRHSTGFAVGAAGGPAGLFFLPRPGLALLPSSDCSQRNWPPDNDSLPRHHYQCNKQSKECAKSSSNTDTLCVLRMCQMVSWWHVLIISEVLFVYFFNNLFVHEFYISKCFMDLWFVRISWMLVYSPVRLSRVILNPLYSSFPKAQRDETGGRRVKSK